MNATAIIARFTAFCPLNVMGLPVISSCSLPNAMNDPVTVRAPKSTSSPSAAARPCVSASSPLAPLRVRYSTTPTSVAAIAPNACENAMNCGIAVILIFIAIG